MIVLIGKQFDKDVDKINDPHLLRKLEQSVQNIRSSNSLHEILQLKKLKGYSDYFRIRIGDYRLGIKITGSSVVLLRFLHRKDIYKYFPAP